MNKEPQNDEGHYFDIRYFLFDILRFKTGILIKSV